MRNPQTKNQLLFIILCFVLVCFSGCMTPKKIDKYVAEQYNNTLPKPSKKTNANIDITSVFNTGNSPISKSTRKLDKLLPLIVYWKYYHRQSCSLNPYIAVAEFTKTINALAGKDFIEKLNGRKLDLTVEQAPTTFSIVVKEDIIWLIYAFEWMKVYVEPDFVDLVVSYKLTQSGNVLKTGTITVKNLDSSKGIWWFRNI